jgi:SAM-dependent methyltransferase
MQASWTDKVYSSGYDDKSLRGVEDPRPWDIIQVVREHCPPGCSLLDVGCGTARKILPLAAHVGELWGLEPSAEMRSDGQRMAISAGVTNLQIVDGTAASLPFPDERFDVVTSMLAPHDSRELARVLRPGGIAIVEKIGEGDKLNIKEPFGEDHEGPRGQFMLPEGGRERLFRQDFSQFFDLIDVRSGRWKTVFSFEGLLKLLHETNTIRNFDVERDAPALRKIQTELASPEGIVTSQHRLLFIARKADQSRS